MVRRNRVVLLFVLVVLVLQGVVVVLSLLPISARVGVCPCTVPIGSCYMLVALEVWFESYERSLVFEGSQILTLGSYRILACFNTS